MMLCRLFLLSTFAIACEARFAPVGKAFASRGGGDPDTPPKAEDGRSKFIDTAQMMRKSGALPKECHELDEFEDAALEGLSDQTLVGLWLRVRLATIRHANATNMTDSVMMLAMETNAYHEKGKISGENCEEFLAELSRVLDVGHDRTIFQSSTRAVEFEKLQTRFEGQFADRLSEAVEDLTQLLLSALRDTSFVEDVELNLRNSKSQINSILQTADQIDATRKEFLEALEGALRQSPNNAAKLALQMKQPVEFLLGRKLGTP